MDDCIEAQWRLYIEYMRETLNPRLHYYSNTLDYYTLNTPLKCNANDVAFEEFTKHTQLK
jgi:hypothetical protein